jgi:leucyl aminopeptidase (aminopeptidase T)
MAAGRLIVAYRVRAPMTDASIPLETASRLASHVLRRNLGVRRGQSVLIESWTHCLPWARGFVLESRRLGARPLTLYEDEEAYWESLGKLGPSSVGKGCAAEWAALSKTDAYVFFWGPGDRARYERLPPNVRAKATEYNENWYKTAGKAHLCGARMELGRVTPSLAEAFGVDLDAWREEIVRGTMVDPAVLAEAGQPLVKALLTGKLLQVRHPNGTDLSIPLLRAKPTLAAGRVPKDPRAGVFERFLTLPAGSVTFALDGKGVEGTLIADRPSIPALTRWEGGRWDLRGGKLTAHQFTGGGEDFEMGYGKGGKGRDMASWIAFGLNPELKMAPQYEDTQAGVFSLGIGRNLGQGGHNTSSFQGYLSLGGAEITIDGKALPLPTPVARAV